MEYQYSNKTNNKYSNEDYYNKGNYGGQGGNYQKDNTEGSSSYNNSRYNKGSDNYGRQNQYEKKYQKYDNTESDYKVNNYNQSYGGYNKQPYNNNRSNQTTIHHPEECLWITRYNRRDMNWKNVWDENDKIFLEHSESGKHKKTFDIEYLENTKLNVYLKGKLLETTTEFKNFSQMPLHEKLQENLVKMGFDHMTPIQRRIMPYLLEGKDAMGCAQTGSGKTVSFLAPIIDKMLKEGPPESDKNLPSGVSAPVALILAPTRELAEQIYKEGRKLVHKTGMLVVKVYGGVPLESQTRYIMSGCDILVATPGRLIDFMKRNLVTLNSVKYLVFDEADRMLDMGFEDQLKEIILSSDIPPKQQRLNMMFSATFDSNIRGIAGTFMNDYYFIATNLDQENNANENIEQNFIYAEDKDKVLKLHETLQTLKGSVIIFLETKRAVDNLNYFLNQRNYNTIAIHGDKTQDKRQAAITSFSKGEVPILIATDVASRGLDFPNIPYVINYDLPNNIDDYIHRIGRTGRCGNKGTAISFVNENCRIARDLYKLLVKSNQKIPEWFNDFMQKSESFGGNSNSNYGYKKKNNFGNFNSGGGNNNFSNYPTGNNRQSNFNKTNYVSVPANFFKKGENFKKEEQVNNNNTNYGNTQTAYNPNPLARFAANPTYKPPTPTPTPTPSVSTYNNLQSNQNSNSASNVKFTRGLYYNNPYPNANSNDTQK